MWASCGKRAASRVGLTLALTLTLAPSPKPNPYPDPNPNPNPNPDPNPNQVEREGNRLRNVAEMSKRLGANISKSELESQP